MEKRQVRSLPSAVSRTRLQSEQNGSETGLMKPISPWPSAKANTRAVADGSRGSSSSGWTAWMIARSSSPVSTWSGDHVRSASSGMNSMKRTWNAVERANSANGTASCSVKPRSATALTLIGCTSGCAASASSPRSTCASESRRVIWKKRSRSSVSSETLTRSIPASTSAAASRSSR